jgi:RNA polymerase sigma factor (sigma-70 family)
MDLDRLLEDIRSGDLDAATELHNWLSPQLKEYVQRRIGRRLQSRVDAEDVVQETMANILAIIRKGNCAIRHVDRLAKTLAKQAIYRVSQRKSIHFRPLASGAQTETRSRIEPAAKGPGPRTELIRGERNRLIQDALASLKPEQALIVRLRLAQGERKRKFKEIGEIVGMSPAATEKAYLRAKAKIKNYLQGRRGTPDSRDDWP